MLLSDLLLVFLNSHTSPLLLYWLPLSTSIQLRVLVLVLKSQTFMLLRNYFWDNYSLSSFPSFSSLSDLSTSMVSLYRELGSLWPGVRTFRPTDCSSQIVQKILFYCFSEAGLVK